ncbi:hypothetical protein D3C81_1736400 [compost metagenome]
MHFVEQHLHQRRVQDRRYRDAGNGLHQRAHAPVLVDGLELKPCQADPGNQEQGHGFAENRPV